MIETGGGVSGALRSLCSPNVPLRANGSGFAIAFGSCLLRYMAATSAVKLSKRLEVVINCWCCDCWLPSEPQSQLTSPSQGREHLPKSGRLLPLNLRQQHTTCLATYLDLIRSYLSVSKALCITANVTRYQHADVPLASALSGAQSRVTTLQWHGATMLHAWSG